MCRFIETIRIENGVAENLAAHNRRMNLTREFNFGTVERLFLEDYISPQPYREVTRCRVTYSERVEKVEYFPYHIREIKTLRPVEDDAACYSFKSADRSVIERSFSKRGEADDVVIVKNGLLTDTSIANIALWRNGVWHTPRVPLLKGTRRRSLLDAGMIMEADIALSDLYLYERICLFNAMIPFGAIELNVSDAFGDMVQIKRVGEFL